MKVVVEWLRKPIAQLLLFVVLVVVMMEADDRIEVMELRAAAKEREAREVASGAQVVRTIRANVEEMESSLAGVEDPVQIAQRVAESEKIEIASSQSGGTIAGDIYSEAIFRVRVQGVYQAPLIRFLRGVEAARPGLLVRELIIRKSIRNPRLLDAEFELSLLTSSPKESAR